MDSKRVLLSTVLLVLILEINIVLGIKCYYCTVAPPNRYSNNTKTQLCSKFNHSDHFTVDCPWSTMCMKRIFKLQLLKAEQETISRSCAQQKNTEQIYKNGNWTKEHNIEEPYQEGCQTIDDSTYCFCRGSLCNSAPKVENSYHTDAMAVIFVFNVMKYIRNIEY
ncbi:uncharacterized protein LOC129752973 [Uranotaenia lowii]|uniref:uncharacterized protein LOC129752973 n=1 Tax=Uranotaenia lowii TaxID=190385 RepID=UPI002478AA9C|nr:uncharacterized protein LOC129752973 [Uranotaenia lowii]